MLPPAWQAALHAPQSPPAGMYMAAPVPLPLAPGDTPAAARPAWLLLNTLHEFRVRFQAAGLPAFAGAPPGGADDYANA